MRISRPLLQSGAVLAALAIGLSGCGSSPKKGVESAACKGFKSGSVSDSVTVTGGLGKTQKAKFDKPLKASGVQRTILKEGTGDPKKGDTYDILVSVLSGKTGKPLGSADNEKAQYTAGDASIPKALKAALDCVKVGSRSVVTVPAKDVFTTGVPSGVDAKDTLVIVADLIGKHTTPKPAAPPKVSSWSNPPKVTFGTKGPTVKLTGKPATSLQESVLKPGTGATVKSGDNVTVDYLGVDWNTGKTFDSSYQRGQAATFATDQVVPGFGAALVGQKVGSRLLVAIPAKYGYGSAGNPQAGIGGKDTIVFVIEVKKTASQ